MKLASNPIDLRVATESELKTALTLVTPADKKQNTAGYSFYMSEPKQVLVSETAFPGYLSFYSAIVNADGELESAGWLGKL